MPIQIVKLKIKSGRPNIYKRPKKYRCLTCLDTGMESGGTVANPRYCSCAKGNLIRNQYA